jgi:hypothetical protein
VPHVQSFINKPVKNVARPMYKQERDTDISTTQASQNTSVVPHLPLNIYKPVENVAEPQYKEKPNTEEEWGKPESIVEVIEYLKICDDIETLRLIPLDSLPPDIFELALQQLPSEKCDKLRQWVTELA